MVFPLVDEARFLGGMMNTIFSFLIEVVLTLVISVLLVRYLRPYLRKVLIDLCGTEDRAQFWTAFSNILLIGMPIIFALNYRPEAKHLIQEIFIKRIQHRFQVAQASCHV